MNKIKLYNFIIILSVVLCFFNEILNGIIQKNYLDKVSFFMLLVTGMFNLSIKKRLKIKYPFYFLAFLFLSFIYFVFSYNTLLSFVYEYAKIFNFLLFIPILRDYNNKDIICLTNKVLRVISIFLFINLIIIVLQFLFGNSIIRVLGYSDLRINGSEYNGRLTGFIHLGTLGPISLLFMILNRLFNFKNVNFLKYSFLALLNIFFSTSKISYGILLIFILIEYKELFLKYFFKIILGTSMLLLLLYIYVEKAILSKIKQYSIVLENLGNSKYINLNFVEKRAIFIDKALTIFYDHPFGLGFGTYGDSSAKLNPQHYQISKKIWLEGSVFMSDSAIAHYIAEQGLFYILYLMFFFSIYKITKAEWKKYVLMLLVFYFLNSMVTMGLSSGNWPILFSLIYSLFYYSKLYEKKRV